MKDEEIWMWAFETALRSSKEINLNGEVRPYEEIADAILKEFRRRFPLEEKGYDTDERV